MTAHLKQDEPDTENFLDTMKQGVLGKPVSRVEGLAKVTGTAPYAVEYPVENAAEGVITDAGTPRTAVTLPSGARALIEIPKFGEPPPLTIDVLSTDSADAARSEAESLCEVIAAVTGWEVRVLPDRLRH